jgi:hypothetical protein
MKIYVEVEDGLVTGVYTDSKNSEIEVVMCDHDNANQETENDGFEFESTNNCNELKEKRKEKVLREIY